MSALGTDDQGRTYGRTYFVGGAGPVGNLVGTVDVPRGLRQGGYRGSIEVFGWQSIVGGTLRDVMDRARNEKEARRLATRIRRYLDQYPGRRVNIIALSAGTGIATWALEALPPKYHVGSVVFLSSALSRRCDLRKALSRVDGQLYCFHSPRDPLLLYGLALTGSVDRESGTIGAAGVHGFEPPPDADDTARDLYALKVRNRPHVPAYSEHGYHGWHTDCTSPAFIAHVVAPLLMDGGREAPRPR